MTVPEDLVHDVFAQIWAEREQWQVRDSLSAYLYAAVRNRAVFTLRRQVVERRWEDRVHAQHHAARTKNVASPKNQLPGGVQMPGARKTCIALAVVLAVGACMADRAYAQQVSRLDLGVAAGPSPYDLSGTGTALAAGIRAPWEPRSWLVIEPGAGFLSYRDQFEDRKTYLFPELSIQGQLRVGRARPFLGGGVGGAFVVGGDGENVETLHGVLGTRLDIGPDWVVSGEIRVRAVNPWGGNTADFLIGVNRRLR